MSTNKNQSGVWTRVLHSLSPTAFSFYLHGGIRPTASWFQSSKSPAPLSLSRLFTRRGAIRMEWLCFFSSIFFRYGSQGRLHAPIIYKILAPTSTPLR
jgi:hypothetical protein